MRLQQSSPLLRIRSNMVQLGFAVWRRKKNGKAVGSVKNLDPEIQIHIPNTEKSHSEALGVETLFFELCGKSRMDTHSKHVGQPKTKSENPWKRRLGTHRFYFRTDKLKQLSFNKMCWKCKTEHVRHASRWLVFTVTIYLPTRSSAALWTNHYRISPQGQPEAHRSPRPDGAPVPLAEQWKREHCMWLQMSDGSFVETKNSINRK